MVVTQISNDKMEEIIKELRDKSESFNGFCSNEISKLNGKQISWEYNPDMKPFGLAIPIVSNSHTPSSYKIQLKKHPIELSKTVEPYLVAHEIGHCIQYEQGCPRIFFHRTIMSQFIPLHETISSAFSSMIYDCSVDSSLRSYDFEIPFLCYRTSTQKQIPYYIFSIICYVLIKRSLNIIDRKKYTNKIKECTEMYKNPSLTDIVKIGDEIFDLIEKCNLTNSVGNINPENVCDFVKEVVKKWDTCFKSQVAQSSKTIFISPPNFESY